MLQALPGNKGGEKLSLSFSIAVFVRLGLSVKAKSSAMTGMLNGAKDKS